jgi:energy-coupling factor transporter ATP-binding protein EcfA2
MQKIKSITLRNFKFFYGTEKDEKYKHNKIELDENNLLLFGENGSGKSSIYWALYTFLQSCLKSDDDKIKKYFIKDGSQSLRNRYAKDTAESGILVEFVSVDGKTTQEIISNKKVSTNKGDTFIKKTLISSDFLNYKYLAKLYDFRNSEPIDLFPLFVKDLLMFIDFEDEYRLLNGELSGKTNAADWWDFILDSRSKLPKNKNTISVSSDEYKRYKDTTIPLFVEHLKSFLLKITESANKYLTNEFGEPFTLNFNTESISADFNKSISQRAKDGKLHKPKINLTAKLIDPKLVEEKQLIHNPHTFLNEARLTAIALAIRFAMLDERGTFKDAGSVLVLDDLLLSLDMSHRNIVLDIILKKESKHQILILTHDKFFFQMARNKIKHYKQDNWEYIEMYSHKNNDIPLPLIYKSESYLGKAIHYLAINEYEIAGNFLRKESENFLKEILSKKYRLNDEGKLKALGNLLTEAVVFSESNGLNKELFEKLNSHREFVLNPASHDSYDVPKFYSELSACIDTLTELRKIEIRKEVLKKGDEIEFTILDAEEGATWRYEIKLGDDIDFIKEPDKDGILTKVNVNFRIYKDGTEQVEDGENERDWRHVFKTLKNLYDYCYNKSDKTGEENYLNGIVYSESKAPIASVIN